MLTERQTVILGSVTVIAVLVASVGFVAVIIINQHSALVPNWMPPVYVSDVQFEEGYLNVTITSDMSSDIIVNEVIIYQDHSSTILTDEIVNTPISGNETISIYVNLNWASLCVYRIHLITTAGNSGTNHLRAPYNAARLP